MREQANPLAEGLAREQGTRSFWQKVDHAIALAVDFAAAVLVAAEVVVLSVGVFARYVLYQPLLWSDEVALILFMWLAMLGSVVALQRDEHMRLAFLINKMPQALQRKINGFMLCTMIAFLITIFPSTIAYTELQRSEITPALEMPASYRVVSIAIAIGLFIFMLVRRLFSQYEFRELVPIIATGIAFFILLWLSKPVLVAIGDYNLIVFFVVMVLAFVLLGMPIGLAFGTVTVAFLLLMTKAPLTIVMNRLDGGISDLILLSIPLFILLGYLIEATGLAKALIDLMIDFLGHVKGGLYYVLLCGMYLVSGISGSKAADMAAIAPILLPEMRRRGAKDGELISLLSASGAMAETIPPSIILISIGVVTGVSIASLFTAGLVPAAVGAVALAVVIYFRTRHEVTPNIARASLQKITRSVLMALPALALPILIRSAVVNGVATATEVATIGILYSYVCGILIYGRFPTTDLLPMLVKTASLSGVLLLIIGMANVMAWALTQSGFAAHVENVLVHIPFGKFGFLATSIVIFAILGSLLEGFPAIVLIAPLMFPVAVTLGVHEVQYAMVAVLAMSLGLFSPPFGVGFYSACAVGGVNPDAAMRDIWVYMASLLVATIIVAAVPWLSLGFL